MSYLKKFVMDENGRSGVVVGHSYVTQTLDILWSDGSVTRGAKFEVVQFVRHDDDKPVSGDDRALLERG